ncbi:DUF302 domain-containing protein [bacterium]|nr:DUF302 domain-containing protein [bacterium]
MENKNPVILYQREACPYCQIVRKKLELLNLSVLLIPVEERGGDRTELIRVSGQKSVPVLVDNGKVIAESAAIIEYLDNTYGTGDQKRLPSNEYGLSTLIKGTYEEVIEKTISALKTEGFGVLTEIDVKKTLKKKIGVDVPGQVILGACNPGFAHQALQAEEDLGLLLPCNIVVREVGENEYQVSAVNPLKLLSVVGRNDLLPVAAEVKTKMNNVISAVSHT